MMDDPETVRLNIRQYRELLKLYGTKEIQDQVRKLLDEAEERLPAVAAKPSDEKR
jgi:hypothetical protein